MALSHISTTPTLLAVCLFQALIQLSAHADCSLTVRLESPVERGMRRATEGTIPDSGPNEFPILTINRGAKSLTFDEVRAVFYSGDRPVTASTIARVRGGERQYFWSGGSIDAPSVSDISGAWPSLPRNAGTVWTFEAANATPPFCTLLGRKVVLRLFYKKRIVNGPCVLKLEDP